MSSPIVAELVEIAEICFNTLEDMREQKRRIALKSLESACDELDKAWSGSNFGYHAAVYTADLTSRVAEFSPEWGLMDCWPTHEPHRSWRIHDDSSIEFEVLRRACVIDVEPYRSRLAELTRRFDAQKEHAISALYTIAKGDDFIARRLGHIEKLDAPTFRDAVNSMLRLSSITRDSEALSQGTRVAVHQRLAAIPKTMRALEEAFEQLQAACRDCARHLGRAPVGGIKSSAGATVFIGHGRDNQWLELQTLLEKKLGLRVIHFNHESAAGIATKDRLAAMVDAADFAFLVMTAEDEQADGSYSARDNVVHEVGLFQTALGFEKAIVMLEEPCLEFSNIAGLGQIRFPSGRIRACFEDVREVLEREKIITV